MAIHNTSQRAKQVLRNFRRQTIDMSSFYSSRNRPEDSRQNSVDEPSEEETGERDSDASGTSGNITDEDEVEYISSREEDQR